MRTALTIFSCLFLFTGMWLAGLAFYEDADAVKPVATGTVSAPQSGPGAKVAVGVAMIGGGVMLLYLSTRR